MQRPEAEAKAVGQLGNPRSFARKFSPPTRRDWLVDGTAWWSSRVAATLLGLGALMVLIEAFAWSIGAGPVSAQAVESGGRAVSRSAENVWPAGTKRTRPRS
jgi:hypothetical protein